MISAIKSEFLKLFTVRSTYYFFGSAVALEFLFAFYLTGWRAKPEMLMNPHYLSSQLTSALNVLILLVSFTAVLLVTHEYRHNTIAYTLTANKSRSVVFFAKIFVITCLAVAFGIIFGFMSPALSVLAIKAHGLTMAPQDFHALSLLWRGVAYCWFYFMFATILAFIIRVQVGALVALFLIPSLVENLLGLLLKSNQVYLPFSVINTLMDVYGETTHITYIRGALVGGIYTLVGFVVAWLLFVKRDAS